MDKFSLDIQFSLALNNVRVSVPGSPVRMLDGELWGSALRRTGSLLLAGDWGQNPRFGSWNPGWGAITLEFT